MFKNALSVVFTASLMLAGASVQAQQFEVVHMLNFQNESAAQAALDGLFADDAMKKGKATLYAYDLGDRQSTHFIVEDFDGYTDRVALDESRRASHGWSKFLLATQDSEYLGSELIMVVDDYGDPRHTAGYLVAFTIHSTDAATYREAIKDLYGSLKDKPDVFRLVAMRSGNRAVTHALLIGGKDFAAVNAHLDKLYASKALAEFVEKVRDTRQVVGITMYRRIGAWGY